MEAHSQAQPRSRKRARARVSESGNTPNPAAAVTPAWGPQVSQVSQVSQVAAHTAHNTHPQAVRGVHGDTVAHQSHQPPTGFPSQQLDRAHQVAESDGLMNGYSQPPQHAQYPDAQPQQLTSAPQPDPSSLGNLNVNSHSLTGDTSATNPHQHPQHPHAHQHHLQQPQPHTPSQQQQQSQQQHHHQQQHAQHQQQPRQSAASANKTDRVIFQQYAAAASQPANDSSPATVANSAPAAPYNLSVWPATSTATPSSMPPQSPAPRLAPPPDCIYPTFDDLLGSVQKVAKDQGYGVVKLRASNYRDGKPTRYDLVCDRGGVKYSSTAKKRNPSTRKVDCPWRAKAVCEVNLGNQWRFAVQEARHNHEPRIPAAVPGQENTPLAQSIRSIGNKIDRMSHDMTQGFSSLEATFSTRLDAIEKRLDALEGGRGPSMLSGNGVPLGTPSMPTANMGGGNLGNGPLTNGGMVMENRLGSLEARVGGLEQRAATGMDSLPMMDDEGRLGLMVNS